MDAARYVQCRSSRRSIPNRPPNWGEYLRSTDLPEVRDDFSKRRPGDAMYLIDVGKVRISITDADGAVVTIG